MHRGQRRIKCSKALLSEGQAWCSVECKRLGLLESIHKKYEDAKLCQKVLGYNANALYPGTMLGEMPFSREEVYYWPLMEKGLKSFLAGLRQDRWFGFAEVDIKVPTEL